MNNDQRSSFRIQEAVRLQVEEISDAEWQQRLETNAGSSSGANRVHTEMSELSQKLERRLSDVKRVSAAAAACIEMLNSKLDLLVEAVKQLQRESSDLQSSPLRIAELSSTGIRFATRRKKERGQKLYLRFVLVTDGTHFETLGQVVRVDPGEAEGEFMVAVEFRGVRDTDKDVLIRHMLNRQSETIRLRRLSQQSIDEMSRREQDEAAR